ncbi:MAG: PEP-CTERM sorting domain-containing protein [Aquabacterium sp.]
MAPSRPRALLLMLLSAMPVIGQAAASPVISTVTSRLSNLQIELIDLAPNDGIAPSITFNGSGVWDAYGGTPVTLYSNGLLPSSTVTHTSTDGSTVLTASPSGIEITSQLTYDALQSNAAETAYDGYYRINGSLGIGHGLDLTNLSAPDLGPSFTLSPHTLAIVRGNLSTSWTLDGQAIASQLDPKYSTWSVTALGSPNVEVGLQYGTEFRDANGGIQGGVYAGGDAALSPPVYSVAGSDNTSFQSNQASHDFMFSIANVGDGSEAGTVAMSISTGLTYTVSGFGIDPNGVIAGIPEPGTWMLMGLGLVGIALARRQRG